jgi:hypothetical protein
MPERKDGKEEAGDRAEFERLLRAAQRFADACVAGRSGDQLEKLRNELANALRKMDENSRKQ